MAIRIDYTPIASLTGLAGLSGLSRSANEARRRKDAETATAAAELARLQQVQAREQADLARRNQDAQEKRFDISSAMQYNAMQQEANQAQAQARQRDVEQQARRMLESDRIRVDQSRLTAQQQRDQQRSQSVQQRDQQVMQRIASVYSDPAERARAELLYTSTGELPREVLIPKGQAAQANATKDTYREMQNLKTYLATIQDDFGLPREGYEDEVKTIRQRMSALVQQDAPEGQSQNVSATSSARQAPRLTPQEAQSVAVQQIQADPAVQQEFSNVLKQQYESDPAFADMMPFDAFVGQVKSRLGSRGPLDLPTARTFFQQAGGNVPRAKALSYYSGFIDTPS